MKGRLTGLYYGWGWGELGVTAENVPARRLVVQPRGGPQFPCTVPTFISLDNWKLE